MNSEAVQLGMLPPALINGAMREIAPYVIGFCRREETSAGSHPVLLGSGTLVQVGSCFAILTAEHVLQVLPTSGRLGLLLEPSHKDFTVDIQGLNYLHIARGTNDRDGPDLGAIILSPEIASAIGAKKQYWNLSSDRERLLTAPPDRHSGFWIANGFPDSEKAVIREADGSGYVMRYLNFCGVGGPNEPEYVGVHDYYNFPVTPPDLEGIPRSFGGMSGGGLWQLEIRRPENGEFSIVRKFFSGVVFYQIREANDVSLKCHGRCSVYTIAHDAILASLR